MARFSATKIVHHRKNSRVLSLGFDLRQHDPRSLMLGKHHGIMEKIK
jgi:hypothetical protein